MKRVRILVYLPTVLVGLSYCKTHFVQIKNNMIYCTVKHFMGNLFLVILNINFN